MARDTRAIATLPFNTMIKIPTKIKYD